MTSERSIGAIRNEEYLPTHTPKRQSINNTEHPKSTQPTVTTRVNKPTSAITVANTTWKDILIDITVSELTGSMPAPTNSVKAGDGAGTPISRKSSMFDRNLKSLQRLDEAVNTIVCMAPHVTVYAMNVSDIVSE
jgi:hypothetical protein